jgi:hypothetical protein
LTKELLVIREPGSGSREVVNQLLSLHAIQPPRALEIGSTEAIKQLVAAGLGISIVSAAAIKDQVNLGRLKMIEIDGIRLDRMLWQLKVPGRMSIPAADVFEKLIERDSASESRFVSSHSAKAPAKTATAAPRRSSQSHPDEHPRHNDDGDQDPEQHRAESREKRRRR